MQPHASSVSTTTAQGLVHPPLTVRPEYEAQVLTRLARIEPKVGSVASAARAISVMQKSAARARQRIMTRRAQADAPLAAATTTVSSTKAVAVARKSAKRKINTELLDLRLERLGLGRARVLGDGNCLFRSFAYEAWGDESLHATCRRVACYSIWDRRDEFKVYFDGDRAFERYLRDMRRDRSWGDELVIKALSDALDVNVHLVSSEESHYYIVYADPKRTRHVFLSYLSPVHYDVLELPEAHFLEAGLSQKAPLARIGRDAFVRLLSSDDDASPTEGNDNDTRVVRDPPPSANTRAGSRRVKRQHV